MNRRSFLAASLALAGPRALAPALAQPALGSADMHSHWGMAAWGGTGELNAADGLRAEMQQFGILLVAMKVIADFPQTRRVGNAIRGFEYAASGTLRKYFEGMFNAVKLRAQRDRLVTVGSSEDLKTVLTERRPGIALAAEGGDFLEGNLGYLETARSMGLCHLQLVHYRVMEVGDISTEPPKFGGLSAFGRDVVRACNHLGILIDVAHCSSAGIQHALEVSTRPLIYSHGWVAQKQAPEHSNNSARAVHLPLAKEIAARGGVVGAFPLGWRTPEAYAEYLQRLAGLLGPRHVGLGTDHSGLPSSALSGYQDLPRVAAALTKAGISDADVAAIMGGNYLRVLEQALAA